MLDPPGDETTRRSLQSTLDEHHGCMQAVVTVEDVLARRPDPPDPWLADLLERLGTLRATLAEHFESEQSGALYREVPFRQPHLASRIDRLAGEHDDMLTIIDGLRRRGEGLHQPETYQLRELNGRVQMLIATIRRHEAEENEIVMNAFWSETGGCG